MHMLDCKKKKKKSKSGMSSFTAGVCCCVQSGLFLVCGAVDDFHPEKKGKGFFFLSAVERSELWEWTVCNLDGVCVIIVG